MGLRDLFTLRGLIVSLFLVMGILFVVGGSYHGYTVVTDQVFDDRVGVEATVVSSNADWVYSDTGPDNTYRIEVTYRYTYDGTEYTNDNVVAGNAEKRISVDSQRELRERMRAYEPGTTVTAHVDPNDPSSAYLDGRSVLFTLLLSGVFVVVGIVATLGGALGLLATLLESESDDSGEQADDEGSSSDATDGDDTDDGRRNNETGENSQGDDHDGDSTDDQSTDDPDRGAT